ncbi:coth protein-domain-containing protein [Linnemannia elongata]|nr:coth protein-domain-containing protein [Linnemannia elongata]
MRSLIIPGFLALIASSALADVVYNVVGFPDTEKGAFGVVINNKLTPLTTTDATFPLWSANVVGANPSSGYRYVKLDDAGAIVDKEKFLRRITTVKARSTPNEFYQRQNTFTTFPAVPQIYPDVLPSKSKAFDDTQIATIHLTADPVILADMLANPLDEERKAIKAGFRFINADTVYSAAEVKLKVSGHGSRKFKKLSLKVKFNEDKGETFFNRPVIKLRSESSEPTFIREKLYFDSLNAIGVVTTQGAWVRVYVNKKPFGFHLLVEDMDTPFLRNTIHKGNAEPAELGSLYQMGSHVIGQEGTLIYNGSLTANYNPDVYSNKNLGANTKDEPIAQFAAFMKDLAEYDPTLPGGLKFWNTRLNVDQFLKAMVMEYLGGAWDGSWWKGNNFLMYFNPTEARWQFIPTDFDSTFSDGNLADVAVPYKQFAASRLRRKGKDHPLITKLIYKNKEINKEFEKILKNTVQKVFNNAVLDPRIAAYEKFIEAEAAWDFSIDRSKNPGKDPKFTISTFHNSLTGPVTGISYGVKPWINYRATDVPKQIK